MCEFGAIYIYLLTFEMFWHEASIDRTDHICRDTGHAAVVAWYRRDVAGDTHCRSFVRRWSRPAWRFSRRAADTSSVLGHPRRDIPRTASCCTHESNKNPRPSCLLPAREQISRRVC